MKFDIRIVTCDRTKRMANGKNYIDKTIANFLNVGGAFSNPVSLYISHPETDYVDKYRDQFKLAAADQELNGNENFIRACTTPSSGDIILILEDDLDFSSYFMYRLSAWVEKYHHFITNNIVTLYTPYGQINQCLQQGKDFWNYPIDGFYGTQGILGSYTIMNECGQFIKNVNGMLWDMAIKEWLTTTGRGIISTVPSFVQHIGDISSIHGKNIHTAPGFLKNGSNTQILPTTPIISQMKKIEGWFGEEEADLLINITTKAILEFPDNFTTVEIGSYCGRSTIILGNVIKALQPEGRIYAIDPHNGMVSMIDQGIHEGSPTLDRFKQNVTKAGLLELIEIIQKHSFEVDWNNPIHLLLIDGLHDFINVARDFFHFEPWIVEGGYIAFHDYADHYPGVKTLVDQILATQHFTWVNTKCSLLVAKKAKKS